MNKCNNTGPYVLMSGRRDSTWFLDYLSGLLLPFIVWCVSPSVNLITSVRAAVLSSLYDNCYFVNIPEKTQQSIDVPQKCHCQVASWLWYTSSLQVYRVLGRKSFFYMRSKRTWLFQKISCFFMTCTINLFKT